MGGFKFIAKNLLLEGQKSLNSGMTHFGMCQEFWGKVY